MSNHISSLPENWLEKIWLAMRAAYGATFDRQWETPAGADPEQHVKEMKAMWGRGLAQFQQSPKAISEALDNLPQFPPNLMEFRDLCKAHVPVPRTALPAPAPRPVQDRYRDALKQLSVPIEDPRPEKIRVAYRYINLWGGRTSRTAFHIAKLEEMRKVVSEWERDTAGKQEQTT